MSVAFRRESDEEHLEPRFELPIPPGPNPVTPRGLAMIEERVAEIDSLLATELDEEQRKATLRDARYWRNRLATARMAPVPDGRTVAIGTRVTFARDGVSRTLTITGHDESDPATDRIAFSAPLARAMIGSEVGDEVEMPGRGETLSIMAIEVALES